MKFIRLVLVLMASALFFAGCASNPMQVSPVQTIQKVDANATQVVFMRSSFVGSAINASLYEIVDGEPQFIGILANATRIAYPTTPGKHTFMVVSEAADFMEADLAPGLTYYSIVTPRMGAWKARFSLWPIKKDSSAEFSVSNPEFSSWQSNTSLVSNSEKSLLWFQKSKASVVEKQQEYWPVWQEKSAEDKAKRTLAPEDGL